MQSQKLALLSLEGRVTLFYLRQINDLYQQKYGPDAVCPLLLKKTNFERFDDDAVSQSSQFRETVSFQLEGVIGAEKIILPSITLHEAFDRWSDGDQYTNRIIHPIDLTIETLRRVDCQQLMLVSSKYGAQNSYLRSFFENANIDFVVPDSEQQNQIDDLHEKIKSFSENKLDIARYSDLISNYARNHTVVVACTELSLALPTKVSNVFDMVQIQIDHAINLFD